METTDLFFTSYLIMKGYGLTNFEAISKYKKKFEFEISVEDWKKERIDYCNSDVSKVKQIMESLKDLSF